jgi:hypothetical protein
VKDRDTGGPGASIVLLTEDAAVGEALAFACARRGIDMVVTGRGRAVLGADVVVLDLDQIGALSDADLSALLDGGVMRVIAISEQPKGDAGLHVDAWLDWGAEFERLTAAITAAGRVQGRERAKATREGRP